MAGVDIYPDTESSWIMAFANKNVFFKSEAGGVNSDARVMFHYPYTAVTPAMAVTFEGAGSDYAIAFLDADKNHFDGGKEYKLHIPANVPVNDFWALTIYDSQTRSLLQTDQQFPTIGSQTEGFKQSELLSALSLIRKYIWEFALSQGMWQKTIDIYRTLELERRMMLFFDKASYHVCKGYEKEISSQ